MTQRIVKIGSRGSPLARLQAQMAADALHAHHPRVRAELVIIETSGDWKPAQGETRLAEQQGGKGLFIKEIEAALLRGDIDCAVHSMKDVPSFLPEGTAVDHVLPRADVRDALISHKAQTIESLPPGAVVGTSSLRRQAFLLNVRPDLKVVPFRGNVQTRLDKLAGGQVDATFLAMAGLKRLGIDGDFVHPVSPERIMPACGQGIIAIETRLADEETRALLDAVHDRDTGLCAAAERAALQMLDGSCHTPIGAFGVIRDDTLSFTVAVGAPDGGGFWQESGEGAVHNTTDAALLGAALAARLKETLPPGALE